MAEMAQQEKPKSEPKKRDIRRYKCEYCGITRSKKSLLASHLLSHHQEEMKEKSAAEDKKEDEPKSHTCKTCGQTFSKPAHLKQHMISHSLERPYACPEKDCCYSFKRKDHLTRHLIRHKGEKLFECPVKNCNRKFSFRDNVARHVLMHDDETVDINAPKEHKCTEFGCEKVFKYASKLRKHMESHEVKMDSVEAYCSEPGCMKPFTNEQCLKEHIRSSHQHIICGICKTKQLKKNIKRHLMIHEAHDNVKIKCTEKGCLRTFSTKSNLQKHVKAVHDKEKPFACLFAGCDKTFALKHVRDNHMKSGCHVYAHGDFVEADEEFRSRPRGGCKRKCPPIEALMRKRIVPPNQSDSVLCDSSEILSRWMSSEADD